MRRLIEVSTTSDLGINKNLTSNKSQVPLEADNSLPTLTKARLAKNIFGKIGVNKREANDVIGTIFNEICCALERGEMVKLSGFGNFQLRHKPQRPGRNPKTAKVTTISARRVVTFQASQKLKHMIESKILFLTELPATDIVKTRHDSK
jgi:integration host factor subunit alpha